MDAADIPGIPPEEYGDEPHRFRIDYRVQNRRPESP
jgi:hypothetical protein